MTKILNGYAQPDIEAEKEGNKIIIYVETPNSFKKNIRYLKRSITWIKENEPDTRIDLIQTVPRPGGKFSIYPRGVDYERYTTHRNR